MFGLQDYELRASHCEIKEFESSVKTVASLFPANLYGVFFSLTGRKETGCVGVSHLIHSLQLIMGNYHTA